MKFENVRVMNFENALRGMRNPKESWHLSDSVYGIGTNTDLAYAIEDVAHLYAKKNNADFLNNYETAEKIKDDYSNWLKENASIYTAPNGFCEYAVIGPTDMKLAQNLIKAGPEHRKFLRQIFVSVDITAPLFWWKEADTYKVGTVANSTSTMHKLMSKPITIDCFEIDDFENIEFPEEFQREGLKYPTDPDVIQMVLIPYLEFLRQKWVKLQEAIHLPTGDIEYIKNLEKQAKKTWKELVRWLPEAWLQTRTITMNYENLLGMCSKGQRRFHKLNEWSGADNSDLENFIAFARSLPYAEDFIFIDEN
jgi:hypothetical protein